MNLFYLLPFIMAELNKIQQQECHHFKKNNDKEANNWSDLKKKQVVSLSQH